MREKDERKEGKMTVGEERVSQDEKSVRPKVRIEIQEIIRYM